MVVLDGGGGQDLLMDALVGARPWTVESDRDPDEPYVPGTPEPAPLAGSVRQYNVTSSLSLLEPVCHQVSTDMRRALEFIEVHFREPISLADVARAASYSRCHFCKLFRQQLGLSFVTYLSHVRIRRAMVLLARSDRSITEIAFDVGFNDLSHFERVFRAVQGQTPTRFRQIAKQSPDRGQDPPSARSLAVTSCIVSTVTGVRSAADAHVSCHPGSQLACRPRTGRPMHQSTSVPGSTESSPRREDGVIKYQVGAPAAGGTSPAPTTPGARSAAGSSGGDPP
jgi:AraC-like DNA-binding protein